jgi:hypothetical protein
MLRCLTAIGFLLCLFACSEEPAKDVEPPEEPPPTGGLALSTAITFPDAKRFAPYEHKVKLTVEAKLPLKGKVPDRFMFSKDGRLLGVPRSPAGEYEFTVGEGKCSLKVVEQPHALPDVPVACDYACACTHDGKIYLFGGRADIADFTGFAHSFDPAAKKWEELPGMPHPKQRASAAALGGKIYVIGGYSGEESVLVHIFDPEKKAWSEGPMLTEARYAGCAVAVGGKIYYIGGWISCRHSAGCG